MRNVTQQPEAQQAGVPLDALVRDVLAHRYPELSGPDTDRIVAASLASADGAPASERSGLAVRAALVRAGRQTGRLPVHSREELDWRLDGIDTTLVIAGPRPAGKPAAYDEWEEWGGQESETTRGSTWARAVTVVAAVFIAMEAIAVLEPGTQLGPDRAPQQARLLPPASDRAGGASASGGSEPEAPAALVRHVRAKLREPLPKRAARRPRRAAVAAAAPAVSSAPAARAPAPAARSAPVAQAAPIAQASPAPAAQPAPAPAPKPAPAATPKPAATSAPQRFDDSG